MSSEFANLEMKDYTVFILGVIASMKVSYMWDHGWAEGLKDRIERVRAMHAHFTVQGSEVPLTLESCPDLEDALTAYNSLVSLPLVSSILRIQGKIVICMPPLDPPANKGPTVGVHGAKPGKPAIASPILQPALAGSTPRALQLTPNCDLGGAHLIDHGSGIQHAPNITTIPRAPSAQSRQPSPLPIRSIVGDECPMKPHAGSPLPDAMLINELAPICTASAMPPPQLQMTGCHMGALSGNPALFAARYGVLATCISAIPSNHRKVTQALFQLEKCIRELEGSDDEFPSKEEEEVMHSISTGTFDPGTGSRSSGDERFRWGGLGAAM
ncbi:hypothetical protein BKA93DRAFT_831005 [Sparassis latifolia]